MFQTTNQIITILPFRSLLRLSFEVLRLAGLGSRGVASSRKLPGEASGLRSSPKLSRTLSWMAWRGLKRHQPAMPLWWER